MPDMGGGGGGCGLAVAAVVVVLLVIAAVAMILPGQIADIKAADAQRIEARAELVEVRAAAEHQRAVDGDMRLAMYATTLAGFLGGGRGDALLIAVIVVSFIVLLAGMKMLLRDGSYQ